MTPGRAFLVGCAAGAVLAVAWIAGLYVMDYQAGPWAGEVQA